APQIEVLATEVASDRCPRMFDLTRQVHVPRGPPTWPEERVCLCRTVARTARQAASLRALTRTGGSRPHLWSEGQTIVLVAPPPLRLTAAHAIIHRPRDHPPNRNCARARQHQDRRCHATQGESTLKP